MKSTLSFEHGKTTCAVEPGKFCRFFQTVRFGTQPICGLYDEPLYEDYKFGWVQRCKQCNSEFGVRD